MSRSNLTNFAAGTLLTGGTSGGSPRDMTNTDTAFMLQTGQGAAFPTVSSSPALPYEPGNFVVCVDSELILCSSRSADTFIVWSDGAGHTGRGYDGTLAASHTHNTAVVVEAVSRVHLDRVAGVSADTFNFDVPAWARGGMLNGLWDWQNGGTAPTSQDDEFETQGPWQVYPLTSNLPGGGDIGASIDFGASYRSCLHFTRSNAHPNANHYFVYKAFTPPSAPYVIACKMHHGGAFFPIGTLSGSYVQEATFGVSDLSNPTGGDVGNQVRIDHHTGSDAGVSGFWPGSGSTTGYMHHPMNKGARVITNVYAPEVWRPSAGETYFAVRNDGSGNPWSTWIGDGGTWRLLSRSNAGAFTPQTIFFKFLADGFGSVPSFQEGIVDWVRILSW
jgi:hypothetical protein